MPQLAIGECRSVEVLARPLRNETGIRLEQGATYDFAATGTWMDLHITCSADGYDPGTLPFLKSLPLRLFGFARRVPRARWFALIGELPSGSKTHFVIGASLRGWRAPADGDLAAFANDVSSTYKNNSGSVTLTVCRRA
jgi:hypothetical protein